MTKSIRILPRLGMALAAFGMAASPLAAQVETIDPDSAIDGDLVEQPGDQPVYGEPETTPSYAPPPTTDGTDETATDYETQSDPVQTDSRQPQWSEQAAEAAASDAVDGAVVDDPTTTYREDDLIGAAEGVFGKGAEGVAKMIRGLLEKQGEPNGYIVGREAGGAFIVGARYGSGTLYHKIEGELPVYWTGPSIGLDAGANAGSTFVLVYNLYDTEELYERYPAGEGQAYVIGGLTASYLRKGDVVLIPIRMGAGLRLGINAGYMKFSKEHRWLPF
ncbi:DUF1134 domain-containing protein [Qipengyuania sp. HL-TH1]|jgi:hypothetical protein